MLPKIGAVVLMVLVWTVHAAETAPAALKPACRGLMIRDYQGRTPWPFVDNVVVQVNWKDLESEDQRFDGPGWTEIDKACRKNVKIRLRIFAGIHAPDFVKRLGGPGLSDEEHKVDCSKTGGVAVWNQHDKTGGIISRFWLPEYLDQYEQLMVEVARRYEETPEIQEIVASGCMTVYAEPFYRAHADQGTNKRLFTAGLNFEKDRAAHQRVIEIHNRLFKRTRTSLAINAWDIIDDSSSHHRTSFEPTFEFVQWARKQMGERLVLQNNGTGLDADPEKGTERTNHFAFLKKVAGPKGFQTRTLPRLDGSQEGLYTAIEKALSMGANFVELPAGYERFGPDRLKTYDSELERNY